MEELFGNGQELADDHSKYPAGCNYMDKSTKCDECARAGAACFTTTSDPKLRQCNRCRVRRTACMIGGTGVNKSKCSVVGPLRSD